MAVLKLVVAYDGTAFHGFARQPRTRTVEGTLRDALDRLLGDVPAISVAGRTDAGVHAEGQVVSLRSDAEPERVQRVLNDLLGPEIAVLDARRAPAGFDARHSATAREYRYRIRTSPVPDPFTARYEWHRPGRYPLGAMRRAARDLVGEHDFASFCRAPTGGATTVRRLERLTVRALPDTLEVAARANGFLHQMVRSLVGTLVAVADGRIPADAMADVLAARSRAAAGPVAPPHGLTLIAVRYGRPRGVGQPA